MVSKEQMNFSTRMNGKQPLIYLKNLTKNLTLTTEHIQEYTLSIAFTNSNTPLFVQKEHGPESLRGKLIFPGGKVDEGEDPLTANSREFFEETGIQNKPEDWAFVATINYPHYVLHVWIYTSPVRLSLLKKTNDVGEKFVHGTMEYDKGEGKYFVSRQIESKSVAGMEKYENLEVDGLCAALLNEVIFKA